MHFRDLNEAQILALAITPDLAVLLTLFDIAVAFLIWREYPYHEGSAIKKSGGSGLPLPKGEGWGEGEGIVLRSTQLPNGIGLPPIGVTIKPAD